MGRMDWNGKGPDVGLVVNRFEEVMPTGNLEVSPQIQVGLGLDPLELWLFPRHWSKQETVAIYSGERQEFQSRNGYN